MERTAEVLIKAKNLGSIWNIPNLLSLFRIITVPFLVVCLYLPGPLPSLLAFLSFGVASLTDMLDGYIARWQKSETSIGKLLDPLADKLLINSAMIMLIPLGRIPAWMVVVIVAREVAVTGLRGVASAEGMVIAANSWGKAKTVLQTFALLGLMLHYEYGGVNCHAIGMLLLWAALILTVGSGVDYFVKFYWEHQKR
jgi:CDP-diacylglycerol---glycerol-3-phosphate 3-phosphatidyltransferase